MFGEACLSYEELDARRRSPFDNYMRMRINEYNMETVSRNPTEPFFGFYEQARYCCGARSDGWHK